MGICQSTKEKGPIAPTPTAANHLAPVKVESIKDVGISRSDFIQKNEGKFTVVEKRLFGENLIVATLKIV